MKTLSLTLPGGQDIQPPAGIPTGGLGQGEAGQRIFQLGADVIFALGVILAVIFIIISGIQIIVSGGDKQKIQAARERLTYSVIGLLVIAGAFFIVSTVIVLLGGNPFYFFPKTNTSQLTCGNTTNYVSCGNGRYICGTTDQNACKTTTP